jgi:antibiotic biosynthesis monooxygenase (ABM) superfamily enzyme
MRGLINARENPFRFICMHPGWKTGRNHNLLPQAGQQKEYAKIHRFGNVDA